MKLFYPPNRAEQLAHQKCCRAAASLPFGNLLAACRAHLRAAEVAAEDNPIVDTDSASRIVEAYLGRCALCGHGLEHEGHPVGIEAAHIRWHNQEGPDELDNGLALCILHHKLLDRGFWRLHPAESATLCLVSDKASGDESSLNTWLFRKKVCSVHIRSTSTGTDARSSAALPASRFPSNCARRKTRPNPA